MSQVTVAHTDRGLLKLLARPWVYRLQKQIVGYEISRTRLVEEFMRPRPGDRILDIGCGPGDILAFLPDHYGHYEGFDMNRDYIDAAIRRWGNGGKHRFSCETVDRFDPQTDSFDTALAIGLVHHLHDDQARRMFELAHAALRPGGRLLTHDCVYVANQSRVARWIISKDRGKAVRTAEGYSRLARSCFETVEPTVLHDMFRMPYTILVMECRK